MAPGLSRIHFQLIRAAGRREREKYEGHEAGTYTMRDDNKKKVGLHIYIIIIKKIINAI